MATKRRRVRVGFTFAPEVIGPFEHAAAEDSAAKGSVSMWLENLGRRECKRLGIAIAKAPARPRLGVPRPPPVPRARVRRPPKA